jgi:hypothetical protein
VAIAPALPEPPPALESAPAVELAPGPAPAVALAPTPPEPTPMPEPVATAAGPALTVVPEPAPPAELAPTPALAVAPESAVEAAPAPDLVPGPAIALAPEVVPEAAPAPVWSTVGEGFVPVARATGTWDVKGAVIRQLDANQFFAKLGSHLTGTGEPLRLSVSARSLGTGWVGLGLHVLVSGKGTHRGYGEGDSWLVWLTRDPVHFAKNPVRLQVYHSVDDVKMDLVSEVPVNAIMKDWNQLEVTLDPAAHTVAARVNGGDALTVAVTGPWAPGPSIVLRALDRAEFKDFLVEAKR